MFGYGGRAGNMEGQRIEKFLDSNRSVAEIVTNILIVQISQIMHTGIS